jgi:hypothetical protein
MTANDMVNDLQEVGAYPDYSFLPGASQKNSALPGGLRNACRSRLSQLAGRSKYQEFERYT